MEKKYKFSLLVNLKTGRGRGVMKERNGALIGNDKASNVVSKANVGALLDQALDRLPPDNDDQARARVGRSRQTRAANRRYIHEAARKVRRSRTKTLDLEEVDDEDGVEFLANSLSNSSTGHGGHR